MAPENDPSFRPDQAACGVAAPCSVTRAPPLVRALCPSRCPRLGPGGMRCRARHLAIARCWPRWRPGHRRAEGRGPRPTGSPHPGCRDVGTVRARPSPALSPPWPGCRCPGTGELLHGTGRGPVAILRGCHPRKASQAPSHVRPCRYRCGLSGARFLGYEGARDLTGIPGAADLAWLEWRWAGCQCLRAAVSPHRHP